MFERSMRKGIEPYLRPGEELLNVTVVQSRGTGRRVVSLAPLGASGEAAVVLRQQREDAEAAASTAAVRLSSRMGLAVTPQRLLIFRGGGFAVLKAKELLSDVPVGDVESIEVGKGTVSKPITLTIRGESFEMEAPRATNTDKLVAALEQAKGYPSGGTKRVTPAG